MSFKISFIGAGNVTWHIAKALENAGNSVQEVFSREPSKAKEVVSYLYNAKVHEDLDFSDSAATVFFLCVPESA
jgi:pyrroline-5-carboxylate reductase